MTVFLHDKIDSSHLIHELHARRKHNPLASLDLVTLKDIPPPVLAMLALQLDRIKDILLLLRDF